MTFFVFAPVALPWPHWACVCVWPDPDFLKNDPHCVPSDWCLTVCPRCRVRRWGRFIARVYCRNCAVIGVPKFYWDWCLYVPPGTQDHRPPRLRRADLTGSDPPWVSGTKPLGAIRCSLVCLVLSQVFWRCSDESWFSSPWFSGTRGSLARSWREVFFFFYSAWTGSIYQLSVLRFPALSQFRCVEIVYYDLCSVTEVLSRCTT